MRCGPGILSFELRSAFQARNLPQNLKVAKMESEMNCKDKKRADGFLSAYSPSLILPLQVWTNATSLGGVESLVDYRHRYDSTVSPKLIRASVGLEHPQDLIDDLLAGFKIVAELEKNAQKS